MSQVSDKAVKLLRLPAVSEMTGISTGHVYRLVRENKFPKPTRVKTPKMTVWPSNVIEEWIADQIN